MPDETTQQTVQSTDPTQAIINKYYTPASTQDNTQVTSTATSAPVDPNVAELATLKAQLAELQNQVRVAVTPPILANQTAAPPEGQWLKLLSEGKRAEGEAALAKVLGPQIQDAAVQQALSLMQAERDVNAFVNEVRAANPELAPMEPFIAAAAQQRIAAAQAAGQIKNPGDYVTVYRQAVTVEIENARKLAQALRGAGAQTATTRIAEVRSQSSLLPNAVNQNRDTQSQQQEPITMEVLNNDYMQKRQLRHAQNIGMAVA